jgi:hypothetical protein
MQKSFFIAGSLVLISATAFGDAARYTATLAQPLTQKRELIVENNIFRCEGSSCLLTSHPQSAESVRVCHALRREVGTLTAYVADGKEFDADRLAKCNASGH